ncbi:hypothetical protein D3C72_1865980 [compost metagenome]
MLTPVIAVTLYFFSSLMKPGMSRGLVISTLRAPSSVNTIRFAVSEKMWYSGRAVMMISWPSRTTGLTHSPACSMLATMFLCSSIAPLATPVVPPVYCRKAISSWPRATLRSGCLLPSASVSLKRV